MTPGPGGGRFGIPTVRLGETESTNDIARLLAASRAPEGAVVVAGRQTRGRGRLGRPWASPPGGLWCSVVLRPSGQAPPGLVSLAAGVAAAEAIEVASGVRVHLQWPNDVVIGDRKVCGILVEGAVDAMIVGFGINVQVPLDALPADVAERAASLHLAAGRPVDPEAVLDALLERLHWWCEAWRAGGAGITEAWSGRDAMRGHPVCVRAPGDVLVDGIADGVDPDGALRVIGADGQVRRVVTGDLSPGVGVAEAR